MSKKPVVIITGVSSGIGLATAALFAREGWLVIGTVRRRPYPAELSTLAVDIQVADMAVPADLRRVVRKAMVTYGRIDAVVANAGYGLIGPLEALSYDKVSQQLTVNVLAVVELTRLVVPVMRAQKQGGTIVALSSVAGRVGVPEHSAYSASKFALEGFFESLWYEVSEFRIKLRLIEPSLVKSPFWTKVLQMQRPGGTRRASLSRIKGRQGLTTNAVAKKVYASVQSQSDKLHYRVGLTALAVAGKRLLPDRLFRMLVRMVWRHK